MFINVRDVRLFCDPVGAGHAAQSGALQPRPVLVVLHGGSPVERAALRPGLDGLGGDHLLLHVDLRGHGRSSAGDARFWSVDGLADDVLAFVAQLGVARPVIYGHGVAAAVAVRAAVRAPDAVSGLAVTGLPVCEPLSAWLDRIEGAAGAWARTCAEMFAADPAVETAAAYQRVAAPLLSASGVLPASRDPQPEDLRVWLALLGDDVAAELVDDLGRLACPVAGLAGAADVLTPPALQQALLAAAPAPGTLAVLDGAAQLCGYDQPAAACAVIAAFIAACVPAETHDGHS